VGLLFWRGGSRKVKNTLCQICANLIGTSWHLVTQHATSATISLIKIRVNKLHPCFGSRGSEVQILSPRPFKTMGYSLGCSPFFVMFNRMFNKWGQNAVTPIYTHIPQYPEITGYFFIPSYNRMVPLLTIWKGWSCKSIQLIKTHQASHS